MVAADAEKSNATGINGDQSDNSAQGAGAAYVFVGTVTTWRHKAYVNPTNACVAARPRLRVSVPEGTLGVGAGCGLGAKLSRPESVVWIIFGDGSLGYSLAEFDTFVRHKIPVVAVVGNDACWSQIAREQVEMLGDDVGTALARSDYHKVVEGFGARGFLLSQPCKISETLQQAQKIALAGTPVLVNVLIDRSEFRKGSISV